MNTTSDLCTLTYASRPVPGLPLDDVVQIVLDSGRRNREDEISGVLWYHPRLFVQTIEGAPPVIDDLYGRLLRDTRHTHVTLLERRTTDERAYDRWGLELLQAELPDKSVEEIASRVVGLEVRVDDEIPQAKAAEPGLLDWLFSLLPHALTE